MDFEDEYLDVLQNIEFAIVSVYHERSEMLDYDVDVVVAALIKQYGAEQQQRQVKLPRLTELRQELYDSIAAMCDLRLGRAPLTTESGEEALSFPEQLTIDELVACLKRIRKSVQIWTKQGGRQGYLSFVGEFIV